MNRLAKVSSPTSRNEFALGLVAVYRTGEKVPESGIYKVHHKSHRLPHEVTLLRDQIFPRCCKCADAVIFHVVQLATDGERRGKIILYELPCLEPEDEQYRA